jgi:hypothetical protein
MWAFLILPDCRSCDVRKASSWADKLCVMCRAEIELLEGLFKD